MPPPPPPRPMTYYQYTGTPEPKYAGIGIRLVALVVDNVIITVVLIVFDLAFGFVVGLLLGWTGNVTFDARGFTTLIDFISVIVAIFYFVYYWGMGATPAMRRFGLRVEDANVGGPIGFGRAALRYLGYVLSVLPCYIGLIWAAFDPRKQGWHDKIAASVVVRD